ncbi:unnamed protein product [Candida verbasci]|uniref:Uncharacterized protein n=1 Tax=Candida verbasci TaxID=1227364 RepID=A0A9W4TTL2_9ASCO|nr:unnamed protein product [Candida verbasci]
MSLPNDSFNLSQYLKYSDQFSDYTTISAVPNLNNSSASLQSILIPQEPRTKTYIDPLQSYNTNLSQPEVIEWTSDLSNFLNPTIINNDQKPEIQNDVRNFTNLPSSPISYETKYNSEEEEDETNVTIILNSSSDDYPNFRYNELLQNYFQDETKDENEEKVVEQESSSSSMLLTKPDKSKRSFLVILKFKTKVDEFKKLSSVLDITRRRPYRSKNNVVYRPNVDIYDIGPKILPAPFTNEFEKLKNTKFKPLKDLQQLPRFKLPLGIKSNYKNENKQILRQIQKNKSKKSNKLSKISKTRFLSELDSESKKDRYYSRLNIYELSEILELNMYDISLTKFIESNILEIFGNYCNFNLGYQTWIRDTDKGQRRDLINKLFTYSEYFYPELDKFKLEVIIRRGSYSIMQTRLRRERRLKSKENK